MPKFKVSVTDDQGHMLYNEWIEAAGPMEACKKAVADAGTADVAESEEQPMAMRLTTGNDGLPIGD
jgi:hypothetical protein